MEQRHGGDGHAARGRPGPGRARRLLALGLAAALGLAGGAQAQTAGPVSQPVPGAAATAERHAGKIAFAELVTPDLAATERFYGTLFGWTFQAVPGSREPFVEASAHGRVVAALLQREKPAGRRPSWLTCLAAADVQSADSLAEQHGGRLLFPPFDVPGLGRAAVLADPQGAVFAVFTATAGEPPEQLAAPGDWIWSSLITSDPATDAAFYKALLGYEVFALPDPAEAQHLILASGAFARASVNPLPSAQPDVAPRWLSFVRVDDATAMAAQVAALGGRVVVPPRLDRHGGKIAVVADPEGALFGLMEWSEDPAGDAGDAK